ARRRGAADARGGRLRPRHHPRARAPARITRLARAALSCAGAAALPPRRVAARRYGGRVFVDCHSHVVPSGDDGAQTLADGLELCELAHGSGTDILYATPHVWPHLLLGPERERRILAAFAELREAAPLELRLGYELTPAPELLEEDPGRYVLEGTEIVLVEVPFAGPADGFLE